MITDAFEPEELKTIVETAFAAGLKTALGTLLVARNATISSKNDEIARLRDRARNAPTEADVEKRRNEQLEVQLFRSMVRRFFFSAKENVLDPSEVKKEIDNFQLKFGTLNLEE